MRILENQISKEKQEKVKIIIKSSFEQAADCERLFNEQVNVMNFGRFSHCDLQRL